MQVQADVENVDKEKIDYLNITNNFNKLIAENNGYNIKKKIKV